jgi:hypothetical protein
MANCREASSRWSQPGHSSAVSFNTTKSDPAKAKSNTDGCNHSMARRATQLQQRATDGCNHSRARKATQLQQRATQTAATIQWHEERPSYSKEQHTRLQPFNGTKSDPATAKSNTHGCNHSRARRATQLQQRAAQTAATIQGPHQRSLRFMFTEGNKDQTSPSLRWIDSNTSSPTTF